MKKYNVVIVGAGPAGLRCAEILSKTNLSVLLLEKNDKFGEKICAGGITRKGFDMLQFPDEVIEHKVTEVGLHSGRYDNHKILPEPVVFTVDRNVFAEWQFQQIDQKKIEIRKNAKVTISSVEMLSKTRCTQRGTASYSKTMRIWLRCCMAYKPAHRNTNPASHSDISFAHKVGASNT